MNITARLFATLREGRGMEVLLDLENSSTGKDALHALHIGEKEAAIFLINGKHLPLDTLLMEGDVLSIFPPIGGG